MSEPTCAVIPAFQAAPTIGSVVTDVRAVIADVVVVNDGSLDGTGDAARGAGAHVIDHPVYLGNGHALRTGMRHAYRHGYGTAVTVDAHGPCDVPDLHALLEASGGSTPVLVVGCRTGDGESTALAARLGSTAVRSCLRVVAGIRSSDPLCGLRSYPIPETLGLGARSGRFEYELEVLVRAAWAGLEIRSVPVSPARAPARGYRMFADTVRIAGTIGWLGLARAIPLLRRPPTPLPPPSGPARLSG